MDFLDPNKKRAHKIKLYIGYALMAIAIGLGAVVLLYAAYGYGVDRQGNVFQNGLVFLASTPDAAEVKITQDGQAEPRTAITSDRLVLPAGKYNFEFLKQGYKPWQREVELKGGGIQRLVYPFLFPEQLKPEDVNLYATTPKFATVSPDRGTILIQRPGSVLEFDVFDANDPTATPTNFTLSSDLLSSNDDSGKFELVEWSSDNRHILVNHVYGDNNEYVLVDLEQPGESVNINEFFDMKPKEVMLRDKNADQLYIHEAGGTLLRADMSTRDTSSAVENVSAFQPHGDDMLLYVGNNDDPSSKTKGVFVLTNEETYKLRDLPESPEYLLDLAQFNGNWLVAAGASNDDRVYVYRNPVSILKANKDDPMFSIRTMRISNPEYISFSANAQFIAVQSGQAFDVYDALDDRQYHYEIGTQFSKGSGPATWMDGHRLLTVTDKTVTVFDFDGSNYQLLTPITVGTNPIFDRDYTSLFTVAPSVSVDGRHALVKTPLRAEP